MRPKDSREADYLDERQYRLDDPDADESDVWDDLHDSPTTADGCPVEPDGTCRHGYRSPLLLLGMIEKGVSNDDGHTNPTSG